MTSGCGSGIVERAIPGGIDTGTGAATPSPQLTVSAGALGFGSVTVNTATTQVVTLTSMGTSAVTVSGGVITGVGFSLVGGSLPVTLAPTQSVTLQVQFKPTVTGRVTGQLTIASDSSNGGTMVVALSGTGTAANPQLTVSAGALGFGSVTVNTATTQAVTLTSTGTSAVTVSGASIAGAEFSLVGGSLPVTLAPTQLVTLQVQFKPTVAGGATGQLTISSDSSGNGTAVVALNGTGAAVPHEVDLSWDAPSSSPDPVASYNIYRSTGSGAFQQKNSSPNPQTAYTDSTVVSGVSYNYIVKSVDSVGVESVPSNQITVAIP